MIGKKLIKKKVRGKKNKNQNNEDQSWYKNQIISNSKW